MFSHNIAFVSHREVFEYQTFTNMFTNTILDELIAYSETIPFKLTDGDRTIHDGARVFAPTGGMQGVGEWFATVPIKRMLAPHVDPLTISTRVELCRDQIGSWLRPHGDDPAKVYTLQVYLSGLGNSTQLGSYTDRTQSNSGWAFANTGTELHHLDPLSTARTSIIVNYVRDTEWNDRSVLVEN